MMSVSLGNFMNVQANFLTPKLGEMTGFCFNVYDTFNYRLISAFNLHNSIEMARNNHAYPTLYTISTHPNDVSYFIKNLSLIYPNFSCFPSSFTRYTEKQPFR